MLWRLFNSGNGVERYKHGDSPAWALVTGSSDGVGKWLANEFLSRGFNVFIHGRNAEKLAVVKEEFVKMFPDRLVEVIVADAANVSPSHMADIVRQVGECNLTVLVHNVAWTGGNYDSLQNSDYDVIELAININIRFFTHLIRVLLPILSKHEPALIINVSSATGRFPVGYLSVYGGTKAYMTALSRGLAQEFAVESRKIEVMVAELHGVQSGHEKAEQSWQIPSAKSMAMSIVNSVGNAGNNVLVTPHWGHELMGSLVGLIGVSRAGKIGTQQVISRFKK